LWGSANFKYQETLLRVTATFLLRGLLIQKILHPLAKFKEGLRRETNGPSSGKKILCPKGGRAVMKRKPEAVNLWSFSP